VVDLDDEIEEVVEVLDDDIEEIHLEVVTEETHQEVEILEEVHQGVVIEGTHQEVEILEEVQEVEKEEVQVEDNKKST
jgi:hypothetical protein